MPADDESLEYRPDDAELTPSRPRPARRRLLVALLAIVLAAGTFVAVLKFAPERGTAAPSHSGEQPPPPAATDTPGPQPPREQSDAFQSWVGQVANWLDIPERAMRGYAETTRTLGQEQPDCHLSWVTLAAIGRTTTDHGRAQGNAIGEDGIMTEPLGTVKLRDFYGKVVSAPKALGPMQLPPALWKKWQPDTPDAEPNVQNIDDAALATGRALCASGGDLSSGEQWWSGVRAIQDAPLFLHRVLATANVYGTVGQRTSPPHPAVLNAVNFAIDKIGLPYVWGGNGNESGDPGFDCSGLTKAAYDTSGITLPRRADWQYRDGPLIQDKAQPQLGDLVFYGNPDTKIHHVGIYIGNQQMIDAPTFGQAVQVHPYNKPSDEYAGATRPIAR